MALGSIKIKVVVEKQWNRVTCIMMICTICQNPNIMTAAQCSVKAASHDVDSWNKDYEDVVSRKRHHRHSDCIYMTEFIKQLEDNMKEIQALAKEISIGGGTMKLALNEDLHYHSKKRCKGQILTAKAKVNHLTKVKKLLNKQSVKLGMIWFFSDEKNFSKDQLHNTQNKWGLGYNLYGVPYITKTKFLQTVMIFKCVSLVRTMSCHPTSLNRALSSIQTGYVNLLETDQTLTSEGSCWKVICVAVVFSSLSYLQKESEVVVRKFLHLYQSQFLAS